MSSPPAQDHIARVISPASAAFFEAKYAADARHDPWRFAVSDYEQARYAAIVQALPRARYRYGFEPGCSIGVLTGQLARRCDRVLALDFAPTAIAEAKRRNGALANVEFRCGGVPEALADGDGPFDLIVLAEMGYYFTPVALRSLAAQLAARLVEGGDFLAEHWTGESADHTLGAALTHQLLDMSLAWPVTRHIRDDDFLLSCWRKPAA